MQDANPMCAFSSSRARSSVLGVRPPALIRYRVSGPRCRVPGTWYQIPGGMPGSRFENPHTGYA